MTDIRYSFAPMEGITYAQYRKLHRLHFGGVAKYYTPFIAPDSNGSFRHRFLHELTTDQDAALVPQLLVNSSEAFNATALKLYELGFSEINLNAGCPSGTVFSKHKGAGMLTDPEALSATLEGIFGQAERLGYRVSIKTRMGVRSTEEFSALMAVYRSFPVAELIVHARCREDYYEGPVAPEVYAREAAQSEIPMTYNGDIRTAEDVRKLLSLAPGCSRVMIGRGAVTNPALFRELQGGAGLSPRELLAFHDGLLAVWLDTGLAPVYTVMRMKTLWTFMKDLFPDSRREVKAILKAKNLQDYRSAVRMLLG
ncbi:MAG: tRNA-dihydrouridine synthase family protein [Oscillospiraceae bacterium]|nr:tRNA-dihydrouridine synthase family protein [Oscillospiraceae bacterium]